MFMPRSAPTQRVTKSACTRASLHAPSPLQQGRVNNLPICVWCFLDAVFFDSNKMRYRY